MMVSGLFVFCSQIFMKESKHTFYSKCISNSRGSSAVVEIQRLTDQIHIEVHFKEKNKVQKDKLRCIQVMKEGTQRDDRNG